jgi:anti-anti-sigma factor
VARAGVARVVVDMRDTTFLGSSGIRAIAIGYEAALDAGKELRLENLRHSVRRVFEILEMTALFERR